MVKTRRAYTKAKTERETRACASGTTGVPPALLQDPRFIR
jgi:hypothetical protein